MSGWDSWETQSVVTLSENVTSALNQVCGTLLFTRSGHRPLSPSIQNGRTRTQLICRLLTDLFGYRRVMHDINISHPGSPFPTHPHAPTHTHSGIRTLRRSRARVDLAFREARTHTQPHVYAHTWTVCRSMKTHPHPIITTTPTFRSLSTSPMYPPAPVSHRVRTPCILSIYHH